jgi:PAS domain S-box-containing protein
METAPPSDRSPTSLDPHAVLDALPRAIIVTSPDGEIALWNRRAEELYGWPGDEVLGRSVFDVLVPASLWDVGEEIVDVVRHGHTWEGDFTVLRRDGEPIRVWVSDRPILDQSGDVIAIVGASEEIGEQRLLELRASDLAEQVRLALDAGGLGTFRWDTATGVAEWDSRLENLVGLAPGEFGGTFAAWVALVHPDDIDDVTGIINAATEAKGSYAVEHRVVWPDGSVHWLHGAGRMTLDEKGNVTGAIGCMRDITEWKEAELAREVLTQEAIKSAELERINRERLEFLTTVNDALTAARNRQELMRYVTRAAVPQLCDWCVIFVLPHAGALIPEIEVAHGEPGIVDYARELQTRFPYDPEAPVGMPRVIRTGEAEFYPTLDEAVFDDLGASDTEREMARSLALHSAISVPLVKRGRILGGMQFVMSGSRRRYTIDDFTVAKAVAARIAASLDNLRLSEEQGNIASTLQASLLPSELPDIPGVEVAVRYWAAGEGVEVGGDFYDLFCLDDGTWAVVIGDVCGTGPQAAAVTGLARHTIASAAWHGDDHVAVLGNLNRAMRARNAGPFCTALYGTVRPSGEGAIFTFASGGHPRPIVVPSGGAASTWGSGGRLIGVFDDIKVAATEVTLQAGDTVVLYTDGATDVAPPYGLTEAEFSELVGQAAHDCASAEDVADRLHLELSAILDIDDRDDDIALMVLRVRGAGA